MINFSCISRSSFIGSLLRKCLSIIPKGLVVPVLQGPLKGMRWIVGSQTHGMWLGSYEIEKQLAIKDCLKPGQVFYDVGANVGYYSLLASRYVGARGFVIAFEPLSRNIEYLSRHSLINNLSNLMIVPEALSDHSGKENFSCADNPSACHITPDGELEITVTTLDEFIKNRSTPKPDVIKVDIEGAEIDFLKGSINTLIMHRPIVFIATHSPYLFDMLFTVISEYKLHYRVMGLNGNEISRHEYMDEVVLEPL